MERRFQVRLDELLADAEVPERLLHGVIPRLEFFLQPFIEALLSESVSPEQGPCRGARARALDPCPSPRRDARPPRTPGVPR